ncbi:flagellar biosynthesis anti-sigma factor FlgM [Acidobacterium sp. S8]|uniref:flagellar biosynthesis anti-sigma factor FlgM n=1 Tax=Acidobacterium sp. S8 TaxID=1641854 RepID=UPI00131D2833|nr:flagellar biosynthesis anti-sigma factor FlgM [Acidobacterium sp. S8]
MNVNDGLRNLPEPLEVSQASPVSPVQSQPVAVPPVSSGAIEDRAEVSTAASLAHQDVRMEKVAAVQQAIASGTYHVSAEDVADKLVRQMVGE